MSNIYKKGFLKRLKSLNEENKNNHIMPYLLERPKIKKFSVNPVTPLIKQKISAETPSENIKDIQKPNNINENKHSLFLKRVNMKENKNRYYIEGVYKLFNDESAFLENVYKGRRIVVGKSRSESSINVNARNYNKNNTKKVKPLNKNVSSNNITFNKSNNFPISNNTFTNDISLMQSQKGRKMIWISGKKNDNYISDEELKNIYQECINRENDALREYCDKSKYKSLIQNNNKSPSIKECNAILNLQSLILDKYKLRNMENNKMIDRLLRHTSKKKDNLLINQINDYRIIKEKKDEEEINNIINDNPNIKINNIKEVEKKIQWFSSLREYQNNRKINNKRNRCISSNNKNLSSPQKYFYSFNKKDIIFDLSGNLFPIFAQVTPKVYKEKEKIRDTLTDLKTQKKNSIFNINNSIQMNNLLINNKKNRINSNSYKGLNIKGKKLLNFEIELSKELEGKKKKIIQYPYREDELTTKLFAKSFSVNNFFVPKSVKNTIELHYNKE